MPSSRPLIDRALAVNGDVRIARARLSESRATLQGARAELLPEIGVAADAGRSLQPGYLFPGTSRSQRTGNAFDAAFTANWELDFFGRNRRASESAAAQVSASEAGVHAAQTAVAAEVARNYLELRGLQQRIAVARDSIVNQRDSLRITSARLEVGRGTRLDVSRAKSLLDSTEATLPVLQAAVDHSAYRIATLVAEPIRSVRGPPRRAPAAADPAGHRSRGTPARHARATAQAPARSRPVGAAARRGDREHRRPRPRISSRASASPA